MSDVSTLPRQFLVATASLLAALALSGCTGSSAPAEDVSDSTPSATSTATAKPARPDDAVGAFTHMNVPAPKKQALKYLPEIRRLPGVVRAHYVESMGTISVYLGAGITMKQRNAIVQLMAKAANG